MNGPDLVAQIHVDYPLEHAARQVAGHRHRDALGNARPDHVPGSGATQVVEQLVGDPDGLAGGSQGSSEIAHGPLAYARLTRPLGRAIIARGGPLFAEAPHTHASAGSCRLEQEKQPGGERR